MKYDFLIRTVFADVRFAGVDFAIYSILNSYKIN